LKNITLVEVSYEVANKVGGINTVLSSKVTSITKHVREYLTIGPYYREKEGTEFRISDTPRKMKEVFDSLQKNHGINCYYGKWLVEGEPNAILVDPGRIREKINEIKAKQWEEYKVDAIRADSWYNDPLVWSKAVGIVIEEMFKAGVFKYKSIAHFHEFLSGAGLLHLKSNKIPIATVFTTHATILGRIISEIGREDLYDMINDGLKKRKTIEERKAYDYKTASKHTMERACAHTADVFSAVSETTAAECKFMHGKFPDIVLPNGIKMKKFPEFKDLAKSHEKNNRKLKGFVSRFLEPYYRQDFSRHLIFFISGRFELRNKGIDVFIDALGMLNEKLKQTKGCRPVIAFIWVPGNSRKRTMNPQHVPLSPLDTPPNAIKDLLRGNGLDNGKDDCVKVVYYPLYLSKNDGLIGLNYYDAMSGCDLGVFPSYYEPWGYTPLEAAALGLQSVTTDVSGFGRFMKRKVKKNETSIVILKRDDVGFDDVVKNLADVMMKICRMSDKEITRNKKRAKELSMLCDWDKLIKNYLRAYSMAMRRVR
jgi:phosphorylase/glycogen(starch) synthase